MKTPETKTLLQWINGLPEDVRQKALSNVQNSAFSEIRLHSSFQTLRQALSVAFVWGKFEGHKYWEEIILKHS